MEKRVLAESSASLLPSCCVDSRRGERQGACAAHPPAGPHWRVHLCDQPDSIERIVEQPDTILHTVGGTTRGVGESMGQVVDLVADGTDGEDLEHVRRRNRL